MRVGENLEESCLRAAGRPVAVELKQVLKGVLSGTSQKELQFFLQLKHSPGKKLTLDKIHAMFTRYGIIQTRYDHSAGQLWCRRFRCECHSCWQPAEWL